MSKSEKEILKSLMNKLPPSVTELDEKTRKKIHQILPVPSDHKILWAEILSFGGYPSGVVITNKALIFKATKKEVHDLNKTKTDSKEKQKVVYRIIPWNYFSLSDYKVKTIKENGSEHLFALVADEEQLVQFKNLEFKRLFEEYEDQEILVEEKNKIVRRGFEFGAFNLFGEKTYFAAKNGIENKNHGYGFFAEEAGTILDKLNGQNSKVVGYDNAKNGPDKIVDRVPVQCKYCLNAKSSIRHCLQREGNGLKSLRYLDVDGNPMKIEVAKDQYKDAIEFLKDEIRQGHIKGIKDPEVANEIVVEGKITYQQARNLAKAGTIESLQYDIFTGAIRCTSVLGITAVVTFAQTMWVTKDIKLAAKCAIVSGLKVYGISFANSVIAAQIARTGLAKLFGGAVENVAKHVDPQVAKAIMNGFRTSIGQKPLTDVAIKNGFAKFLGTQFTAQVIMFIIRSAPDTYRIISGNISTAQYVKNMTSLVATVAGSVAGAVGTGAAVGSAIGSASPGVGTVIGAAAGTVGGMVGGTVAGVAAKTVGNIIREDDNVILTRMFNAELSNLFVEYLLTEEEQKKVIEILNNDKKELRRFQRTLFKSQSQERDIKNYLMPKIKQSIKTRNKIKNREILELNKLTGNIVANGELVYEN